MAQPTYLGNRMPFTPIHMGPGLLIKAVLQSGFSLMVFGWTQIVMDVQPLIVMLYGEGQVHGLLIPTLALRW